MFRNKTSDEMIPNLIHSGVFSDIQFNLTSCLKVSFTNSLPLTLNFSIFVIRSSHKYRDHTTILVIKMVVTISNKKSQTIKII